MTGVLTKSLKNFMKQWDIWTVNETVNLSNEGLLYHFISRHDYNFITAHS